MATGDPRGMPRLRGRRGVRHLRTAFSRTCWPARVAPWSCEARRAPARPRCWSTCARGRPGSDRPGTSGVECEPDLAFAGRHAPCGPMLDRSAFRARSETHWGRRSGSARDRYPQLRGPRAPQRARVHASANAVGSTRVRSRDSRSSSKNANGSTGSGPVNSATGRIKDPSRSSSCTRLASAMAWLTRVQGTHSSAPWFLVPRQPCRPRPSAGTCRPARPATRHRRASSRPEDGRGCPRRGS